MGKQMLKYGTGLVALYLVVVHGSGFGQVMSAGANGASQLTRTLQGR